MAKILEETLVIRLSKIVKDSTKEQTSSISDESLSELEQVTQALVGDSVVVEVQRA